MNKEPRNWELTILRVAVAVLLILSVTRIILTEIEAIARQFSWF